MLSRSWDAIFQSKLCISDRVLLSPTRPLVVELTTKIANMDQKITSLPQIFFAEFDDRRYAYSFKNATNPQFHSQRLRRYRSPHALPNAILPDKFESVLALDLCMSVLLTFRDSQQMAAQNLINFYLHEELQDHVGEVIVQTVLSVLLSTSAPFSELPPVYLAILMTTMVNTQDKLRKLKQQMESEFSAQIFTKLSELSPRQISRVVDFLGAYISQIAGKELSRAEPFLLQMTSSQMSAL